MHNKILLFSFAFILTGCMYNDEPMPEIVYSPNSEQPVILPEQPRLRTPELNSGNIPRSWIPPASAEKRWTAIIIHHSATDQGNAAIFDKWHRENNHWDGVGYDFVIGNGSDSGDGETEVTFRWRQQIPGAHCGGTPGNWANEDGIGICLVGDFDRTVPTYRQMQSLVRLINFLKKRYGISDSRIYGHRTTPGARVTDCPGKKFPFSRLRAMLGS